MPRSAKFLDSFCLPRGHGVPQVTPCATAEGLPSSQRTQAPVPGLGVETDVEDAPFALCWARTPRAAEVVTLVEMNCRREMRFVIVIPRVEHPARAICLFLIEYARA